MSLIRDTGRHLRSRRFRSRRGRHFRSWHFRGRHRARPVVVLRSMALAVVVFVVAAVTGAQLAEAEPADSTQGSPCSCEWQATGSVRGHPDDPVTGHTFALSLVYSGTGALAISVLGLVMVGRRRRHW